MFGRICVLLLALPAVAAFMSPSPALIRRCTDFTHLAPFTAAQILGKNAVSTVTERFIQGGTQRRAAAVGFPCEMSATAGATFKVNLMGDTSLLVKNFGIDACVTLGAETNKLVAAFKAMKEVEGGGGKRPIQESMAFSWSAGSSKLEMECNPNLFTNAFNAKVFIKFEDDNVRVSSQAALPELIDAIKDFKAKNVPKA